jgi:hypothetical protein
VASDSTDYAEKDENVFENRISDEIQDRIMNLTIRTINTMGFFSGQMPLIAIIEEII